MPACDRAVVRSPRRGGGPPSPSSWAGWERPCLVATSMRLAAIRVVREQELEGSGKNVPLGPGGPPLVERGRALARHARLHSVSSLLGRGAGRSNPAIADLGELLGEEGRPRHDARSSSYARFWHRLTRFSVASWFGCLPAQVR